MGMTTHEARMTTDKNKSNGTARRHARLELRQESGGPRHYLEGVAVHAGRTLELVMPGGAGLFGHYEWSFQREDKPRLGIALGPVTPPSDPEGEPYWPTGEVELPKDAAFFTECRHGARWPDRCRDCDDARGRELSTK